MGEIQFVICYVAQSFISLLVISGQANLCLLLLFDKAQHVVLSFLCLNEIDLTLLGHNVSPNFLHHNKYIPTLLDS